MRGPVILLLAFFLDLLIGDPRWLPHPVRIIGKAIEIAEGVLRRFCTSASREKGAGVVLVVLIVGFTGLAAFGIQRGIALVAIHLSVILAGVFTVFCVATTIAIHELIGSVQDVVGSVKKGNVIDARGRLSMIVGRDTEHLTDQDVLKAAMETLAENLSDGVVAPLFYLAIGGFPLAFAYKAVNTLDSMVGYKNERYLHFGWAAARLDDLANYIPARITGTLIVAAVFISGLFTSTIKPIAHAARSFRILRRDGRNHTSPNSGIPEAAMAGALGIRMGGPSTYESRVVDKPYMGDQERDDFVDSRRGNLRASTALTPALSPNGRGRTRKKTIEESIEGEAPTALPVEGATLAPMIEASADAIKIGYVTCCLATAIVAAVLSVWRVL